MNEYEELIDIIRKQGMYFNPPTIKIGKMINKSCIKIKEQELDAGDYILSDHLFGALNNNDEVALIFSTDINKYIVLARVVKP